VERNSKDIRALAHKLMAKAKNNKFYLPRVIRLGGRGYLLQMKKNYCTYGRK
jgi:hypothetical protein